MGIPTPILALMQQAPIVSGDDLNYAQRLYDIHDVLCYGVSIFENGEHLTKDWPSLRNALDAWQNEHTLDWKPAEVDEVTNYLNERFFRFPTPG
jgi:hypothetical protein